MNDVIDLNEIDTECPRLSTCVPKFFCERFRGRTVFDQIVRILILILIFTFIKCEIFLAMSSNKW